MERREAIRALALTLFVVGKGRMLAAELKPAT